MSILYLAPASISYLTELILASAIAGYFWYLARRPRREENDPLPKLLLAGAFTSFACATLLLFLNISMRPDLSFYAMPLESIAVALFLALLLQFAYRFPSPAPGQKWEARIVLGLSFLYAVWEGRIAIQRYAMLAQGVVRYRPEVADLPLAMGFLWIAIVLLRQTVRTSAGDRGVAAGASIRSNDRSNDPSAGSGQRFSRLPPDVGRDRRLKSSLRAILRRSLTVWRKLWRPRERGAGAARALALLSLMPLGLAVVDLLESYRILPHDITELIQSLGILFTLSAFALVYLNYLPETTSFMVKLVGATLATVLVILGTAGWIVSPAYVAAYHNDSIIADRQTLRFTPNAQGGYDVSVVPVQFEADFGRDLGYGDVWEELPFDFSFFGHVWREVYISGEGAVSFGQAFDSDDVQYRYGPLPAIFPLHLALTRDPNGRPGDDGLFARSTAEGLTITWYQLGEAWDRETRYTFQLTLYPSGAFDITYNGLPARPTYAIHEPSDAPWVIGAVPGKPELRPAAVRFVADLPYSGGRSGMVEDYYLYFRGYLNGLLLPLAYLVMGSSVLVVVGFPIFFRLNLVRPLDTLLAGVRQVNAGHLGVTMPVRYHDEIGFLTRSFNEMAAQLRGRTVALHERAAELEALARVSSALRQAATSEDMISILTAETVKALGAEAGAILLLEDGALVVAGLHGLRGTSPGHRVLPGDIPCWQALRAGQLMQSDPVGREECGTCELCHRLAAETRTAVVAPLQTADATLGLLLVAFDRPDSWLEEQRRPLVAIAEMGGNALQRARTMETLEQLVQDRTRELATLYDVTTTATQHLDLQDVLEHVLHKALEVVGGQAGLIHLLNEGDDTLRPAARRGTLRVPGAQHAPPGLVGGRPEQVEQVGPLSGILWDEVMERNETVTEQILKVSETSEVSYVGVPIHSRGQIVGVLSLFAEANQTLSAEDLNLLAGVTDHIGAAVESAQLRQRAEEAAVVEERQRLARDLHDAVTQTLFSAGLIAEALPRVWQRDPAEGERGLEELRRLTRGASAEMRTLLLELRPAALTEKPLDELLGHLVETATSRARVPINLAADRDCLLPGDVQIALYRIAQEALNNVARHARAGQVWVQLLCRGRQVTLCIRDNGTGFDPREVLPDRVGMGVMRERAASIGATVEIRSRPGQGTEIVATWTDDEGRRTEDG